jgi:hypothetical protein
MPSTKNILIALLTFIFISSLSYGQKSFTYVYPNPGSEDNPAGQIILLRSAVDIDPASIENAVFEINGNISGEMNHRVTLANDMHAVNLKPSHSFAPGEIVTVEYKGGLRFENGGEAGPLSFEFGIAGRKYDAPPKRPMVSVAKSPADDYRREESKSEKAMEIPESYPEWEVLERDDPHDGYIFTSVFNSAFLNRYPYLEPYCTILDNYGTPVFYRTEPSNTMNGGYIDFKKISDEHMIFSCSFLGHYLKMDNQFRIVDTLRMIDGWADPHECQVLENGNKIFIHYYSRKMDMTDSVENGDSIVVTNARVQEIDPHGNIIFDWNGFGHIFFNEFYFHDRIDWENDESVDLAHINSVDKDSDSTYLISMRNVCYIARINKNTGNLMWKMGGGSGNTLKLNSEVEGEAPECYVQHDARRLENGNISIFDNGGFGREEYSRYAEYRIDEEAGTATLVKVIRGEPDVYALITGSARHLDNGRILIGWGSGRPNITEYKEDGTKALELDAPACIYRAKKYNFKNTIFDTNIDTLNFGKVTTYDIMSFTVFNRTENDIRIDGCHINRTNIFMVITEFPFIIPAEGSKEIDVKMINDGASCCEFTYKDALTFYHDTDSTRISFQIWGKGIVQGEVVQRNLPGFEYSAWPQPAGESITFKINARPGEYIRLELFDIMGNLVETIYDSRISSGELLLRRDCSRYGSGVYVMKISTDRGIMSRRVLISR